MWLRGRAQLVTTHSDAALGILTTRTAMHPEREEVVTTFEWLPSAAARSERGVERGVGNAEAGQGRRAHGRGQRGSARGRRAGAASGWPRGAGASRPTRQSTT